MIEVDSGPKGRKIIWDDELEVSFKEINCMVSYDTFLNDIDCKIPFTVHTYSSDKQLGDFIIQNNKRIDFFSIILSEPQRNYTKREKEILFMAE